MSPYEALLGKKANGPLDYAMLYKRFSLLITEAKKDNINYGVIQNIGQLLASWREFLYYSLASVPSTGVASLERNGS